MTYRILRGDVLSFARHYHGPLFHACLCDPPYHLTSITERFKNPSKRDYEVADKNPHRRTSRGFMSSVWDGGTLAFEPETWAAFSELLYPGAFLMAFASSRGWHRMACAIEDASFSILPSLFGWANGMSFPKATRIDSRIDDRELAKDWAGHRYGGQALKNSLEPIIVAQKPYSGKPINNITTTGAGALNVDLARISATDKSKFPEGIISDTENIYGGGNGLHGDGPRSGDNHPHGRWPSNFILQHTSRCKKIGTKEIDGYAINRFTDGAKPFGGGAGHEYTTEQMPTETVAEWLCIPECPVRRLGEQSGELTRGAKTAGQPAGCDMRAGDIDHNRRKGRPVQPISIQASRGTASRFFYNSSWEYEQQEPEWNVEVEERLLESDPVRYEAKSSSSERSAGLGGGNGVGIRNPHPT